MKKVYLVATIVAIIAAFATYFFATQLESRLSFADVQKNSVVYAAADIPADAVITEEMLIVSQLPAEAISPNTAATAEELIGKVLLYPVFAGEQINLNNLVTLGDKENAEAKISYKLAHDEYAFTFEVGLQNSVGYAVKDGDFINILYNYTEDGEQRVRRLYDNVKVLRVGNDSEALAAATSGTQLTTYSCVTVVVSREQSLELSLAVRTGSLGVELYSYEDGLAKMPTTAPVETTAAVAE